MGMSYKIFTGNSIGVSSAEKQLLTGIDMSMPPGGGATVLIYDHILDEELLVGSLKRALAENPLFAGRIVDLYGENPAVSSDRGGMLFVSESHDEELKNYGYKRHDKFDEFDFCIHVNEIGFGEDSPMVQIKHSKFKNCSVLGFSVSHVFCDGFSFWKFLAAWSSIARGEIPEPLVYDRAWAHEEKNKGEAKNAWLSVINKKDLSFGVGGDFDIDVFRLQKFEIDGLRAQYLYDRNEFVSDQDIAMAYIWTRINSIIEINGDETCPLILVYGTRKKLGISVNYVGNAICLKHLEKSKAEIDRLGIGCAARLLRRVSDEITEEELREELAFWAARIREKSAHNYLRKAYCLCFQGGLMINNWSQLPMYDIDFGTGKPVWVDVPRFMSREVKSLPVCRNVIVVKSPYAGGGVDFYISLPAQEMARLRRIFPKS